MWCFLRCHRSCGLGIEKAWNYSLLDIQGFHAPRTIQVFHAVPHTTFNNLLLVHLSSEEDTVENLDAKNLLQTLFCCYFTIDQFTIFIILLIFNNFYNFSKKSEYFKIGIPACSPRSIKSLSPLTMKSTGTLSAIDKRYKSLMSRTGDCAFTVISVTKQTS